LNLFASQIGEFFLPHPVQHILHSTRKWTALFTSPYQARNDLPQRGQWVNGENYFIGASQDALTLLLLKTINTVG